MAGSRELEPGSASTPQDIGGTWTFKTFAEQARIEDLPAYEKSGPSQDLIAIIEGDIIPRLMLVHGTGIAKTEATEKPVAVLDPAICQQFAKMLLDAPLDQLLAFIKRLADRGLSLKSILLNLCAPTARWLGERWVADDIDFVAVTLGLSRLQQIVHEIVPKYEVAHQQPVNLRALIVPTPGEQHAFGAVVAAQLFRESGWTVDGGLAVSMDELKDLITAQNYAVIGFSQSSDVLLNNLVAAIQLVKTAARAQPAAIIVGGRLATERPELCRKVGADLFVKDTSEAVEYSQRLLQRVGHQSL